MDGDCSSIASRAVVRGRFFFCKAIPQSSTESLQAVENLLSSPHLVSSVPNLTNILTEKSRDPSSPFHEEDDPEQLNEVLQQLRHVVPRHLLPSSSQEHPDSEKLCDTDAEALDLIENAIAYIRLLRSVLGDTEETAGAKSDLFHNAAQLGSKKVAFTTTPIDSPFKDKFGTDS